MKRSILMVAVVIAAMTALADQQRQPQAQQPSTSQAQPAATPQPPVSLTVNKQAAERKVEVFTPLSKKLPPSKQTDKVERVDGMSSQPWFRTVGPRPGWSAFTEPERRDAALDVFWTGAPPTH